MWHYRRFKHKLEAREYALAMLGSSCEWHIYHGHRHWVLQWWELPLPEFDFTIGIVPTSYGSGPFHPAIRNGSRLWYWPNITFDTEDEACYRAKLSLADAIQPMADIVAQWHIVL